MMSSATIMGAILLVAAANILSAFLILGIPYPKKQVSG